MSMMLRGLRADEDMVDAGADLDVDKGTDDDNDSDGEGAEDWDEDVAEFAGLAVNMLTMRSLGLAEVLLNEDGATTLRFLSEREDWLVLDDAVWLAADDLVEGSNSGRTNLRFSEQKTKSETREGDNDVRFFLTMSPASTTN